MTRVFCSIVLLIAAGCSPSGPVLIQGRVFTGPSLFQSTISPGEWFQEEVPLPDCKVWLAFDKEAQDPVEGCETHTVEDGRYQFRVNSNVKPKDTATHEYYLVVEKKGYERLVWRIGLGPYCAYKTNTIFLKQIEK